MSDTGLLETADVGADLSRASHDEVRVKIWNLTSEAMAVYGLIAAAQLPPRNPDAHAIERHRRVSRHCDRAEKAILDSLETEIDTVLRELATAVAEEVRAEFALVIPLMPGSRYLLRDKYKTSAADGSRRMEIDSIRLATPDDPRPSTVSNHWIPSGQPDMQALATFDDVFGLCLGVTPKAGLGAVLKARWSGKWARITGVADTSVQVVFEGEAKPTDFQRPLFAEWFGNVDFSALDEQLRPHPAPVPSDDPANTTGVPTATAPDKP